MPVRLFSGARGSRISFHMLHRDDLTRIKQQLYCPHDERVVERSEIVKGYEYRKGEYVVIEPDEIKKIEPKTAKTERTKQPSEPINNIAITNRNGHKVQLLAAPGLLWRNEGLGYQIGQRLLAKMLPVVITPGEAYLTPANILKTAAACDRLMVLLAKDNGLVPGSLVRDAKPDFGTGVRRASCFHEGSGDHAREMALQTRNEGWHASEGNA